MSRFKLSAQSNIDTINHIQEMTIPKEKKARKPRTSKTNSDIPQCNKSTNVSTDYVEDPNDVVLIKKSRKPKARAIKMDNIDQLGSDMLVANNDIGETHHISLKRKRGRPPKFKNEITKTHWLGFFAFIAEHGYIDSPK